MPKKLLDCVKCGGVHERPINSKCKNVVEMDTASITKLALKAEMMKKERINVLLVRNY